MAFVLPVLPVPYLARLWYQLVFQLLSGKRGKLPPSLLLLPVSGPDSGVAEDVVSRFFEGDVRRVEDRLDRFLHDRIHVNIRTRRSKAAQIDASESFNAK